MRDEFRNEPPKPPAKRAKYLDAMEYLRDRVLPEIDYYLSVPSELQFEADGIGSETCYRLDHPEVRVMNPETITASIHLRQSLPGHSNPRIDVKKQNSRAVYNYADHARPILSARVTTNV